MNIWERNQKGWRNKLFQWVLTQITPELLRTLINLLIVSSSHFLSSHKLFIDTINKTWKLRCKYFVFVSYDFWKCQSSYQPLNTHKTNTRHLTTIVQITRQLLLRVNTLNFLSFFGLFFLSTNTIKVSRNSIWLSSNCTRRTETMKYIILTNNHIDMNTIIRLVIMHANQNILNNNPSMYQSYLNANISMTITINQPFLFA